MSHLTEQQVVAYGQRQLSVEDLLTTDRHISECATCREQMLDFVRSAGTLSGIVDPSINPHLGYSDLVRDFAAQLTEERQEYVLNHILWCEECRLDMLDFSRFLAQIYPIKTELELKSKGVKDLMITASEHSVDFPFHITGQFLKSPGD